MSDLSDSAGMTDEVVVQLNPTGPDPDHGPQSAAIPDRPVDGAGKSAWVEYVVALGADRTYVTSATRHCTADLGALATEDDMVVEPGLTKDQLVELADSLGG